MKLPIEISCMIMVIFPLFSESTLDMVTASILSILFVYLIEKINAIIKVNKKSQIG